MEVKRPKERNLIVGVIYRPPKQSLQEFINDFDNKRIKSAILWPIEI